MIGPLATEASELGLSDEPPPPNVRGPGKAGKKGPSPKDVSPRKPYRIYSSADGATYTADRYSTSWGIHVLSACAKRATAKKEKKHVFMVISVLTARISFLVL